MKTHKRAERTKRKGRAASKTPESRTLFLIRHAIACEPGPKYPDDNLRPLTKRGRQKMRDAAKGFARIAPRIDVVVTSPLVRAKQTADIVFAELDPAPERDVLNELAPDTSPGDLAEALGRYKEKGTIALVGHEPVLGFFAAWLLGAQQPIPFKKGGIACIEVVEFPPGRTSTLQWIATPRMLRAL